MITDLYVQLHSAIMLNQSLYNLFTSLLLHAGCSITFQSIVYVYEKIKHENYGQSNIAALNKWMMGVRVNSVIQLWKPSRKSIIKTANNLFKNEILQ